MLSPHPAILHAMEIVDLYFRATFGREAIVTSIRDGSHGENSYHFGRPWDIREMAFDVRTRGLTLSERERALSALRMYLGDAFDVVLESDHIHIERDVSALLPLPESKGNA